MRILVVEDFAPLRDSLSQALREEGFAVDATDKGQEALWLLRGEPVDLVVLDWMLPDIQGIEVLRKIRKQNHPAACLMLTARDQVADRVQGLDAGADDYLVKPFALPEFLARVRVLVRRRYDRRDPALRIGPLELDTAGKSVHIGGNPVELTAKEYALLEYLAMRCGEVVSRTEIWQHLYDQLTEPLSNVVDVHVAALRRKLEEGNRPRLIHTRRGMGYVLSEPDPCEASEPSSSSES